MPIDTTIQAAAVGGGIAAIISGGFAFWNHCLARRSDERRQIRELAVQAALANWKAVFEESQKRGHGMNPVDIYLIHAAHLVAGLDGSLQTPEQIREHLRNTYAATHAASIEIDEHNKKIQAERQKGAA